MARKSRRKNRDRPAPATEAALADWDAVVERGDTDEAQLVLSAIIDSFGDVESVLSASGRRPSDVFRRSFGMPLRRDMPSVEKGSS